MDVRGIEIFKTWTCSWWVNIGEKLMWQLKDANWTKPLFDSNPITLPHLSHNTVYHLYLVLYKTPQHEGPFTSPVLPFTLPATLAAVLTYCSNSRNDRPVTLTFTMLATLPPTMTQIALLHAWKTPTSKGISPQNLSYPSYIEMTIILFVLPLSCKNFNVNIAMLCTWYLMCICLSLLYPKIH